jgi:arginase family enzyme
MDHRIQESATNLLAAWLSPQGVYTVTTGSGALAEGVRRRYEAADSEDVVAKWRASLDGIGTANAFILGVPMDAGAGFARGSFLGPHAIRNTLMERGDWQRLRERGVLDLGDIRVHPALIHDSMLSENVLSSVRSARNWPQGSSWPVSPLSLLEQVLTTLHDLAPGVPVCILGGDHSISRVPLEVLAQRKDPRLLGCLHLDAHTDLLPHREGNEWSFATWAWHANKALGRSGRLVQAGLRVSGKSREQWEREQGVRQFWAADILQHPETTQRAILQALREAGVQRLYISHDIDANDPSVAGCTGTPEPGGLSPEWVRGLLQAAANDFSVVGCDVVEVAPGLHLQQLGEPMKTLQLASDYVVLQVESLLKHVVR